VKVQAPVTLRDVPATISNLLKLWPAGSFPGHSLARYWNDAHGRDSETSSLVLSEVSQGINLSLLHNPIAKGPMKSLVIEDYHYIRNGDGQEELYNIVNDPAEEHNLAHTAAESQRLEHFRTSLTTVLTHP
jgi:hypothetical protein